MAFEVPLFSFAAQFVGFAAHLVDAFEPFLLRLPAAMETYGMDLHEHGISAYPEYVISAIGAPAGMEQELPLAQSAHARSSVGSLSRATG